MGNLKMKMKINFFFENLRSKSRSSMKPLAYMREHSFFLWVVGTNKVHDLTISRVEMVFLTYSKTSLNKYADPGNTSYDVNQSV